MISILRKDVYSLICSLKIEFKSERVAELADAMDDDSSR